MNLKLMVDYNLNQPVVDELKALGAVKARTTLDYGFEKNTTDDLLVKATAEHGCILLTRDKNTISQREFPPCTHGGIMLIKLKRPFKEQVVECVKRFCQSGKRALAPHSVTHLYLDRATIHTCSEIVEIRY